jgi:hypothetical protein
MSNWRPARHMWFVWIFFGVPRILKKYVTIARRQQFVRFKSSAENLVENFSLRSYCVASSGNFLPTFRDKLIGPIFMGEDWTYRLSRNVRTKLPLLVA